MPRMIILHAAERQAYEAPPILGVAQRSGTFDVPAGLLDTAKALRKPAHRIGFLVSCAYFDLAKRFFAPKDYHARDIRHAAHQLGLRAAFTAADYPARTRQRHEQLILQTRCRRPDRRPARATTPPSSRSRRRIGRSPGRSRFRPDRRPSSPPE